MTTITGGALIGACPCHDVLDCPDKATVTLPATELAEAADLLTVVDEFLRCGDGAAEKLACFYAHRGEAHPRFTANNLIDQVSFTAAALRRHRRHRDGEDR